MITLLDHTNVESTIFFVKKIVDRDKNLQIIRIIANQLRNEQNIQNYLKNFIYEEQQQEQELHSCKFVLSRKKANCVNFCILIASILENLGIGYNFVTVAFDKDSDANHVYLITENNIIIDIVYLIKYKELNKTIEKGIYNKIVW